MADDQIQRAYRAGQPRVRNAPAAAPEAPSASDPLVELARLIGQNDPFAEYGRDGGQRAAAAQAAGPAEYAQAPAHDLDAAAAPAYADERYTGVPGYPLAPRYADERYPAPPARTAPFPPPVAPPPPSNFAQQGYGDAAHTGDSYAQDVIPGHAGQARQSGYEQGPHYPNDPHAGAEEEHFYDDVPPRRRMGVLPIAAVFALAVIGTAGAFGYRALFGSSGSSGGPPPIIKADSTPSKIVPAARSKDPKSGKLIYDRVGNNGQNEKLVSREEQPVGIKDKSVGTVLPQAENGAPGGSMQQAALGSGVIGVEPTKIHTIAIHPNQVADAPGRPAAAGPAPAPMHTQPAAPIPPPRAATNAAPRQVAHAEAPARHAAAPSNVPLSLNPNAPAAPARTAQPTMRTATAGVPTQIAPTRTATPKHVASARTAAPTHIARASSGGYAVQIVARHNEADAQASFHRLQAKYPQQLGDRAPLIRRVDLGAKGVFYRAMVGPFSSADEASQVCSRLKAAGGQCIVQKI
jgi:hypothetical protein